MTSSAQEQHDEKILIDEYLNTSRKFKMRRLYGLLALSGMLLVPLIVIYVEGWWSLSGSADVGTSWVFVGIGVVLSALAAIVIDVFYRKEL